MAGAEPPAASSGRRRPPTRGAIAVAIAAVLAAGAAVRAAGAAAPLTDDAVRAEVDRLFPAVAAARRLPARGPLPARAMGRAAMREELGDALAAAAAVTDLAREGEILQILGLLPVAADYVKAIGDAAAAAPAPLYDRVARRLLVPDFLPLDDQRFFLAREIARALADRQFDLRRFLDVGLDVESEVSRNRPRARPPGRGGPAPAEKVPLTGDERRARLALVEGDATLAALTQADPAETFLGARELGGLLGRMRRGPAGRGMPRWLVELARFTQAEGLAFVSRVRARRPWTRGRRALGRSAGVVGADPPPGEIRRLRAADPRRRGPAAGAARARATRGERRCWASWSSGRGWRARSPPRSRSGPPPAGAAIASRSTLGGDRRRPPTRGPPTGAPTGATPWRPGPGRRWCG